MGSRSGGQESPYSVNSKRRVFVSIGLRSLIENPEVNCNIVVKPLIGTDDKLPENGVEYSCYLKSCRLCDKNFVPGKDIYMYRGDQGFCSLECRDRQIKLDEMKELEATTKKLQTSYKYCCGSDGRRETRLLLEDLRRRNMQVPSFKYRTIFP